MSVALTLSQSTGFWTEAFPSLLISFHTNRLFSSAFIKDEISTSFVLLHVQVSILPLNLSGTSVMCA